MRAAFPGSRRMRHPVLGSSRLAAARKTRSADTSAGRETCRRSTASSWRRTTISSSLKSDERKHNSTSAIHAGTSRTRTTLAPGSSHPRQSHRPYELIQPKRRVPTSTIEFWHPTRRKPRLRLAPTGGYLSNSGSEALHGRSGSPRQRAERPLGGKSPARPAFGATCPVRRARNGAERLNLIQVDTPVAWIGACTLRCAAGLPGSPHRNTGPF
jgi:hypothetical protein